MLTARAANEIDFTRLLNLAKISNRLTDDFILPNINNLIRTSYNNPMCRRVLPLVYQRITEQNKHNLLEPDVLRLLKQTTLKSVINFANQSRFIKELACELEEQQITIYLLKSSALNANLYSSSFVRLGVDIDILVAASDKANFELVLQKLAVYMPPPNLYPFEELYESSWRSKGLQSVIVDYHNSLVNPEIFTIPESIMFACSEQHPEYSSTRIRVFSSEVMIIHLALHVTNDGSYEHYNLLDIHELTCQRNIDLGKLFELNKKLNLGFALYFVLKQCVERLGSPIDKVYLNEQKPRWLREVLSLVLIYYVLPLKTAKKSILHRLKQMTIQIVVNVNGTKVIRLSYKYMKFRIKGAWDILTKGIS